MDVLNDPIAELRRIIKVRVEVFRLATVLKQGPAFGANFFYCGSNICPWDADLCRRDGRSWVLVLPTNVNSRGKLHICYSAIGRLRDLKGCHVQLERRIVRKTLLNCASES